MGWMRKRKWQVSWFSLFSFFVHIFFRKSSKGRLARYICCGLWWMHRHISAVAGCHCHAVLHAIWAMAPYLSGDRNPSCAPGQPEFSNELFFAQLLEGKTTCWVNWKWHQGRNRCSWNRRENPSLEWHTFLIGGTWSDWLSHLPKAFPIATAYAKVEEDEIPVLGRSSGICISTNVQVWRNTSWNFWMRKSSSFFFQMDSPRGVFQGIFFWCVWMGNVLSYVQIQWNHVNVCKWTLSQSDWENLSGRSFDHEMHFVHFSLEQPVFGTNPRSFPKSLYAWMTDVWITLIIPKNLALSERHQAALRMIR